MRKIMLIGKFNTIFQDINNELSQHFSVQVCIDNLEMVRGMLKLNRPDCVILSLIGMEKEGSMILSELKFNYARTPVICIGTESEQSRFTEYLLSSRVKVLTRPLSNDVILKEACNVMGEPYVAASGQVVHRIDDLQVESLLEEVTGEAAAPAPLVQKSGSGRKTVMLVDDSAIQLRSLSSALASRYDVQVANSGMKALTLIGKSIPDIIFLDYEMPMCDGKMTLQMIRELDEAKDIPVVFLTGMKDKEHIQEVLALKPAGYLLKPPNLDTIFQTIEDVLAKQKK